MGPTLNWIHFRPLSSPSQKENLLIQSNPFESVALFSIPDLLTPHTSCSKQSPCTEHTGHVLYAVADIPASINITLKGQAAAEIRQEGNLERTVLR